CDVNNSPDGLEEFNLTTKDAQATDNDGSLIVSYYTSLPAAQAGTGAIATPNAFTNTTPNDQEIWVRVETDFGCASISSFHLIVNPLPVVNPDLGSFYACEEVPGEGEFIFEEMDEVITG